MTEAGLRQAYKSKPEALEEMLKIKTMEELCTLFEDENFVAKGTGKTDRFYEAIVKSSSKENDDQNNEQTTQATNNVEKSQQDEEANASYVAVYPIRCNGELIEANAEVTAEELGDDLERLIKIGAVEELC